MTKIYLISSICIASLIGLSSAIAGSWASPMMPKFNGTDDNPLGRRITDTENSILTSIPILSGTLGSFICGYLASSFGRKPILLTIGVLNLIFFLMTAFARNIWMLYISRTVLGASSHGAAIVLAFYTSELAEPKNRGALMTIFLIVGNVGTLIVLCLGPNMSYFTFHLIPISLSILYLPLFYFFSIESPYHLIKKDMKKTRQVLEKIRNFDEIDENIETIKKNVQKNTNNDNILNTLRQANLKKPLLSVLIVFVLFNQLDGMTIVISYAQTIFEIAKGDSKDGIDPKLAPVLLELATFITNLVFSSIADVFPRKKVAIISFICIALFELPFGIYFVLRSNGVDVSQFSLVPLITLILCTISMNIGVGPIANIYSDEIFPFEIKGIIIAIIAVINAILGFGLTFSFNFLKNLIGMGYLFCIFSLITAMAPFFVKFLVIETKGKSLQQIQEEFHK